MPANLQTGLLLRIMERLGELRDVRPNFVTTPDLINLVPEMVKTDGEQQALYYLDRHLVFLSARGYLRIGPPTIGAHRSIRLTAEGEMFVQPELAEFGKEPLLPQVMKSMEDQIEILTYPQEEKDNMRYRLREAAERHAPEFFAKVLAEIAYKIFTGGGR